MTEVVWVMLGRGIAYPYHSRAQCSVRRDGTEKRVPTVLEAAKLIGLLPCRFCTVEGQALAKAQGVA